MLPGGGELRPVSGLIKSDGHELSFESIKRAVAAVKMAARSMSRQSPSQKH